MVSFDDHSNPSIWKALFRQGKVPSKDVFCDLEAITFLAYLSFAQQPSMLTKQGSSILNIISIRHLDNLRAGFRP